MTHVERTYHDNGALHSETPKVDGVVHGFVRHWYDNGQLGIEAPMVNGLVHGVVRNWDRSGNLLGTYEMQQGTGLEIHYHTNGRIRSLCSYIDGRISGPAKSYLESGEILAEGYWLDGKPVTWDKYEAAAKDDSRLPNPVDYRPEIPAKIAKLKELEARIGPAGMADLLPKQLIEHSRTRDALEWLDESDTRSLGEGMQRGRSIRLVKKLLELGANRVLATSIDAYDNDEQNTGEIIIELPAERTERKRLFDHVGRLARKQGFSKEADVGQQYLLLTLD